jgi:hypothetical protein
MVSKKEKRGTKKKVNSTKRKTKKIPSQLKDLSLKKSTKDTNQSHGTVFQILVSLLRLKEIHNNFDILIRKKDNVKYYEYLFIKFKYIFSKSGNEFKTEFLKKDHYGTLVFVNNIDPEETNILNMNDIYNSINEFKKIYKKNNKNRFFILPIGLFTNNWGHSNLVIIDFKKNRCEYFEPHGSIYMKGIKNIKNIKNINLNNPIYNNDYIVRVNCLLYITKLCAKLKIKLILPDKFMNTNSFQALELYDKLELKAEFQKGDLRGYCQSWSLWYLSLRLKYPDASPKKLVSNAEKIIKDKYSYVNFIRNYSKFLYKEQQLYKTIFKTEKEKDNHIKKLFPYY